MHMLDIINAELGTNCCTAGLSIKVITYKISEKVWQFKIWINDIKFKVKKYVFRLCTIIFFNMT